MSQTPEKPKKKIQLSTLENFGLSGCAAVISKTVAAPIERIKLMIQNQDEMLKQGRISKAYSGPIDCGKRVIAEEGILPLWRGNVANCLRYFPTQALNFAFKERIKIAVGVRNANGYWDQLGRNILSGGSAGVLSLCFVYSLDYARTRLANDAKSVGKGGGDRQFNGLFDVYKQTLRSDGLAGLYRGFAISAVGIFVYRGFYFGFYDTLSPIIAMYVPGGFVRNLSLGYGITVLAGLASYPIDTIRRRMMMTSGQQVKYSGSWDCCKQILKNEGVKSLFKGGATNILRGLAGAGTLAGFDLFKQYYAKKVYDAEV